jgi:hypothetical protein
MRGCGIPAVNVYLAAEVATYHRLPFALQRTYAPAVMSPKEALDVAGSCSGEAQTTSVRLSGAPRRRCSAW